MQFTQHTTFVVFALLTQVSMQANSVLSRIALVTGLAYTAFLCVFALDAFQEGGTNVREILVSVFMHLSPALLVLAGTLLANRHHLIGALVFAAFGTLYLVASWGRFHWSVYLLIAGPLFLCSVLHLLAARKPAG